MAEHRDPIPPLADPPELKIGCEHEWTRWLEKTPRAALVGYPLTLFIEANVIGEFCEKCGHVRIYRPDPEDEAA